jgi:Ca-activated chloride channel homolog
MSRPISSVLALLLLAFPYCNSQTRASMLGLATPTKAAAPVTPLSSASVLVKRVSEVNLLLTVSKKKLFGHELTKDDFAISDNGRPPREITNFQAQADLPLRIALVIDSSDSVSGKFQYERKASISFLRRNLRPGDLALTVVFNEALRVMGPPTGNVQELANQIRKTPSSGHTSLYDAIALASKELNQIHDVTPTRKIIVLLSDGEENNSKISLEDTINEVLFSESVVYSVSTNSADDSTAERYLGDAILHQLADSTGGDFLRATNDEDACTAFRKIERQLRKQYMVSYKPPEQAPDGTFHFITISSDKGFKIHHRRGYFAR